MKILTLLISMLIVLQMSLSAQVRMMKAPVYPGQEMSLQKSKNGVSNDMVMKKEKEDDDDDDDDDKMKKDDDDDDDDKGKKGEDKDDDDDDEENEHKGKK